MRHLLTCLTAILLSFSSFAIDGISGTPHTCVGSATVLTDASGAGTWSSSNVAVATVFGSSTDGIVTGISAGTAIITFTYGGSDTTLTVTVYPGVAAITGGGSGTLCSGGYESLSDVTAGGVWSSSSPTSVSVGSTTGVAEGLTTSGGAEISYTLSDGCYATTTVALLSSSPISGASSVCESGTTTLTDGSGTWSSAEPTIASVVTTTGVVSGLAPGTATISFTATTTGCISTMVVVVGTTISSITGATTVCANTTTTLSDGTGGGTWTSSNTAVATISPTTGLLTPVSAGTTTVAYTTACGTANVVETVLAAPASLAVSSTLCVGGTATVTESSTGGAWGFVTSGSATFDSTTGVVVGISSGQIIISYDESDGCFVTTTVTVNSALPAITGASSVCPGSSITLADGTSGGSWSSTITSVATVGISSGIVTGVATGTSVISYTIGTGCAVSKVITVGATIDAISGSTNVCTAMPSYVSDGTGGGTWSSSATTVATINELTGEITGVTPGTSTIYYTTGCGSASVVVSILASPGAISGSSSLCTSSTETLTDPTSGGTWDGGVSGLTVGATTGIVTSGTSIVGTVIDYIISDGCFSTMTVYVTTSSSISPILGSSSVCVGSTISLTDPTTGGTWSSSTTSVASVSGTGVVTGVAAGTATIVYAVTETCGVVTTSEVVTVNATASAGVISGSSSVYVSGTTTLTDIVAGGGWSSGNPAVATINATTGVVTGVAPGTATISYTVTGCSTAYATYVITVMPIDGISGWVVFPSAYYGTVTVWLITYNPADSLLEAIDSVSVPCGADSVYYQFTGVPTDSIRIKAAVSTFVGTGYIPTYHTSAFYWHDATVLYHVSGTSDVFQDVDMQTGTSTGGPGFIAGNVTSGANRGTSGSIEVSGMYMYLLNTTGSVLQQTITDGTGNYTFSGLAAGTYIIHPEDLNYATTNLMVTLTGSDSDKDANFIQHTVSMTIMPGTTGTGIVKPVASVVTVYPNPASTVLNISWQLTADASGTVTITDVMGREMYRSAINMAAGSGLSKIDLTNFANGLYIISVHSGDANYINKVQVMH